VSDPRTLQRRELHRNPLIDGSEAQDHALARFRRRVDSLLISRAELEEADIERRLRAPPTLTRPNTVALCSPRGGVGKTTATFLAGNLLASHPKLRAIAVDANPGFGTLGRLCRDRQRERTLLELLAEMDRVATAAELRRYVSVLPTGLHLLRAAPADAGLAVDHFGQLLALLACFYDTVLLDLGPGATAPLARLAIERADQLVLVTTPDRLTAKVVLAALDQLPRDETTVLINKAHPHPIDDLRAVERCFRDMHPHRTVTIPYDRRLTTMLDTGTYSLEALDARTRLPVKRLGLSVAEQLV
jgi:MinD-like ATPase involved in chromosome partitioning or flagellar assembly